MKQPVLREHVPRCTSLNMVYLVYPYVVTSGLAERTVHLFIQQLPSVPQAPVWRWPRDSNLHGPLTFTDLLLAWSYKPFPPLRSPRCRALARGWLWCAT